MRMPMLCGVETDTVVGMGRQAIVRMQVRHSVNSSAAAPQRKSCNICNSQRQKQYMVECTWHNAKVH